MNREVLGTGGVVNILVCMIEIIGDKFIKLNEERIKNDDDTYSPDVNRLDVEYDLLLDKALGALLNLITLSLLIFFYFFIYFLFLFYFFFFILFLIIKKRTVH
jgi:hypothetical protein